MCLYGRLPVATDSLSLAVVRQQQGDSVNRRFVFGMLGACGWPAGLFEEANGAIRLGIQNASPVDIERYLPMVEKAAAKGTIEMADDASAFDRMRMHDKLPQHYGSQTFAADPDGRGPCGSGRSKMRHGAVRCVRRPG